MTETITANGIEMAYDLQGPEGAPIVMFGNSIMCRFTMWDHQVAALAGDFRVLRYDIRGQGETEVSPGPYSIELLAEDARALLAALDGGRMHYVGLSLGGFIGQKLATEHPEVLASLTVCDTATHLPPPSLWDERIETVRNGGMQALVDAFIDRWFTAEFRAGNPPEIDQVRHMILTTPVEGFVSVATAIKQMDLTAGLAQIDVPTLVAYGEHDPLAATSHAIYEGVAGARLAVIPNAKHLPNVEQPGAFNRALRGFLTGH